jgi:arylsulfatase A-like enzyme
MATVTRHLCFAAVICLAVSGSVDLAVAADRYNVLFIAVDDLRPELGCYGVKHIKTPNIDKLARSGIVFNRAYCQQAVCSPSRTSLMTGLRPDSTKIYDLQTHFRKTIPDVVTLSQYFKQNGYHAQGMGKIYHGGLDDVHSWSVPSWNARAASYHKSESREMLNQMRRQLKKAGKLRRNEILEKDPETGAVLKLRRIGRRALGPAWEDPDVSDNTLRDGMLADHAIETLQQIKDKPFFLAVGFYKPHLPFIAPKKYFDLYPAEAIKSAPNPFAPKGAPPIALHTFGELRSYADIPDKGPLPEGKDRELIRAYFAATSFIDTQIGRVLDELDRLELRDRTIIILWGDHGWHLGEHGLWCKHTNFEIATRVPMILSAPQQKTRGIRTNALSEFVDIYPTLCDLAGLPIPDGLEGTSMTPLLDDPDRPWKPAVFSQYPRGKGMGYSMRTDRYRYTEWQAPDTTLVGVELYDYKNDSQGNVNIAKAPEHEERVAQLSKMLSAGWRGALPKK